MSLAQKLRSFYPVYTEQQIVVHPEFEGRWLISGQDTVSISRSGDNFYSIFLSGNVATEGVVTRIGNDYLLDLVPLFPNTSDGKMLKESSFTPHSLYKLAFSNDTLRASELNYHWFYDHIIKNKRPLPYVWNDNTMMLTMPTEDLRHLIEQHHNEPGFFQDDIVLVLRPSPPPVNAVPSSEIGQPHQAPKHYPQLDCTPVFPLIEGWLGADGDVSVPYGERSTLWLFSDTFVGKKEQTSRSGSKMVSNTAAISHCDVSGKMTMHYYWHDQYTDKPKPLFESYTDRYLYWIPDALMIEDTLFVLLEKIGRRTKPTAKNENFNFLPSGFTLAKVVHPNATTPDKWKPEYIGWSVIENERWNGQFAKDDKYVYLFVRNMQDTFCLMRIDQVHMSSPAGHLEFYTRNKTWERGMPDHTAEIMYVGIRSQTVEYHADLRQWVMVTGPDFMNDKIQIRTAPKITGPWSDEKLIYTVPELTPGTPVYHKQNQVYLGREHIQYYNSKIRSLKITYDLNNDNFSKVISDTSIYVPRVIDLSIPQ